MKAEEIGADKTNLEQYLIRLIFFRWRTLDQRLVSLKVLSFSFIVSSTS